MIGISVLLLGQIISPFEKRRRPSLVDSTAPTQETEQAVAAPEETDSLTTVAPTTNSNPNFRHYRATDIQRVVAYLKANASLLVTGEAGSGKSVLAKAVVEQLLDEGYQVAFIETATPKQMLVEIAEQLGIETRNLEGKGLTAEKLKTALAYYFQKNVAFLVVDDAHLCELKFRNWLKSLKRQNVPMLLLATEPPRTDVFINLPRTELTPLADYAIRELMEQAALERNINLKQSDLAKLQQRAGGNPMLAARAIDEEYLGLEVEAGDHRRYLDITPFIVVIGAIFIIIRFIGLGTGNQLLYILGGIAATFFLTIGRLLYSVPREGRRIR